MVNKEYKGTLLTVIMVQHVVKMKPLHACAKVRY